MGFAIVSLSCRRCAAASQASQRGFNLIEVMVVVAILAVLAALAVPRIVGTANTAKQNVDIANVEILNRATATYAAETKTDGHPFDGIATDAARIQKLVDAGFLGKVFSPQQEGVKYQWNDTSQCWQLSAAS